MSKSNNYNFRNPVRHFINIDNLDYPADISIFDPIQELCWTKPISFRIFKADDRFREIKMPNILNYVRALYYYSSLPNFNNVKALDPQHKKLDVNMDTGDFVSGNYNLQLNDEFMNLCMYDVLLKLDISEHYGRIYTHYLDLDNHSLIDNPLAWLNNGRTSGVLMGNYLSLYFAEYMSSKISTQIQNMICESSINCQYKYFSDDFYFFCNKDDIEKVVAIFDNALAEYDFVRKDKKEKWDYESYNKNNLLTRYWKAVVRSWNVEVLKDYDNHNKHPESPLCHKLSFLNQLVYRVSSLDDERSKRSFITNFFKTKHFQETDYSKYKVCSYDLHQLFFLIKTSSESLLYISHIMEAIPEIKNNPITKNFIDARFKESLKHELHDEQLYYYYAICIMGYNDILSTVSASIINSQNQVLISYCLKDNIFNNNQIQYLETIKMEDYWFQNYHLILYTPSLMGNLQTSIEEYLIPKRIQQTANRDNPIKEQRYYNFYYNNLNKNNPLINDISDVQANIENYLNLRYEESAEDFDD